MVSADCSSTDEAAFRSIEQIAVAFCACAREENVSIAHHLRSYRVAGKIDGVAETFKSFFKKRYVAVGNYCQCLVHSQEGGKVRRA